MSAAEGRARLWVRVRAPGNFQPRLTTSSSEFSSFVVSRLELVEEEIHLGRPAGRRFLPPRYLHTKCEKLFPVPAYIIDEGSRHGQGQPAF